MSNITENYNTSSSQRATFGVSFSTSLNSSGQRVVTVTLSGTLPGGSTLIRLPAFIDSGVASVQGGTYNASTHAVTVTAGTTSISVTLNS